MMRMTLRMATGRDRALAATLRLARLRGIAAGYWEDRTPCYLLDRNHISIDPLRRSTDEFAGDREFPVTSLFDQPQIEAVSGREASDLLLGFTKEFRY